MKKQALFIIPAIMAASAVNAGGFDGFYVGAGIGDSVTVGSSHVDGSVTRTVPGAVRSTSSITGRGAIKKETFAGELFAGYGWNCDCWYLGGEIYVKGFGKHGGRNVFSRSFSDTLPTPAFGLPAGTVISGSETIGVHAKARSAEWGIDFRPGWLIGECTMLYGRIGAAWNRIHVSTFRNVSFATSTGVSGNFSVGNNDGRKRSRTALRLGAGLEHKFMECWSIRADWVYTDFRHNRHNGDNGNGGSSSTLITSGPFIGQTINVSGTGRTRLHNHTMMLGLSYYW